MVVGWMKVKHALQVGLQDEVGGLRPEGLLVCHKFE